MCWPLKTLWKSTAPYKVSCFTWIASHSACVSQVNLQGRMVPICSRCFMFNSEGKWQPSFTMHCSKIDLVTFFFSTFQGLFVMPYLVKVLLVCWGAGNAYINEENLEYNANICVLGNVEGNEWKGKQRLYRRLITLAYGFSIFGVTYKMSKMKIIFLTLWTRKGQKQSITFGLGLKIIQFLLTWCTFGHSSNFSLNFNRYEDGVM